MPWLKVFSGLSRFVRINTMIELAFTFSIQSLTNKHSSRVAHSYSINNCFPVYLPKLVFKPPTRMFFEISPKKIFAIFFCLTCYFEKFKKIPPYWISFGRILVIGITRWVDNIVPVSINDTPASFFSIEMTWK